MSTAEKSTEQMSTAKETPAELFDPAAFDAGMDFSELAPEARIKLAAALGAWIEEQRVAYYDRDAPVVSDAEYDTIERALERLEAEFPETVLGDSPTQRVGTSADTQAFAPVTHEARMYSLEDVFSVEELDEWFARTQKFTPAGTHFLA